MQSDIETKKSKLLFICYVMVVCVSCSYAAENQGAASEKLSWKTTNTNEQYMKKAPDCMLVSSSGIVCYADKDMSIEYYSGLYDETKLKWKYDIQEILLSTNNIRNNHKSDGIKDVKNITAKSSDNGILYLAFNTIYEDMSASIDLITIFKDEVSHVLLKQYKPFSQAFDLQVVPLAERSIQVFYTDYSEEYFNIFDRGDKQKIGTIKVVNNFVSYDKKISKKGKYHQWGYRVNRISENKLLLSWVEIFDDILGVFSRNKKNLVITKLDITSNSNIKMENIKTVPIHFEDIPTIYYLDSKDRGYPKIILASISDSITSLYQYNIDKDNPKIDKLIEGEFVNFECSDSSTLCRYFDINKGLYDTGQISGSNISIKWSDFDGNQYIETINLPPRKNYISVNQNGINLDCYYWIERHNDKLMLDNICHNKRGQ